MSTQTKASSALDVSTGSARIVEGDTVVKAGPQEPQHGSMRRDDSKGVVLRTREHPTLGFMLLVQHPGRKAPIWWSANHWKLSLPNVRNEPRHE